MSIRRLLRLVAWAVPWLNLWGEAPFDRFRAVSMNHSWQLRKTATYLFDRIAPVLRELLHPHPQ